MDKLQVLIVDDDDLMRSALELVIDAEEDMRVIGSAENGIEALSIIRRIVPDIVLMDMQMPVMDGLECIKEIRRLHDSLPILILTTFHEDEYIFQGLAYGANGYMLKGADFKNLAGTIREALNGRYLLPAEVAASIARYAVSKYDSYMMEQKLKRLFERNGEFTRKEQEIILMLINRLSNKEISARLFLTEGTIKNNLTVIYEKLGAHNRQDAIRLLESDSIDRRSHRY